MFGKIKLLMAAMLFAGLALLCVAPAVNAVEGGFDYYAPGVYGNISLASFPEAGKLYYLNYVVYTEGHTDVAVRSGQVQTKIDDSLWAQVFTPVYLAETRILGGNYFAAAAIPLEWVDVDSSVAMAGVGSQSVSDSDSGLGDISVVPFGLSWTGKDRDTMLYTSVNIPTGKFTTTNSATLGLNYWAFDTNVGMTWRLPKQFELDTELGFLINTKNNLTEYHSGNSVHLDASLAYDFSPRFQMALSGYAYKQVTGDTGSGAVLGDFKGEAAGVGLSAQYVFGDPNGKFLVVDFEYLTDVHVENRMKSDWYVLMLALPIM